MVERLYSVSHSSSGHFSCGRLATGEQVLLGLCPGGLVAVYFSEDGKLLRHEVRAVPAPDTAGLSPGEGRYQQMLALTQALDRLPAELGVTPGNIRVQAFSIQELEIGILDMPDSYLRGLARRAEMSEQEQQSLDRDVREWLRNKQYVLQWGVQYWMSEDGEVIAT